MASSSYKWVDVDFCKEPSLAWSSDNAKPIPTTKQRLNELGARILSIFNEQFNQKSRKKAGFESTQRGRKRRTTAPNILKYQTIYKDRKEAMQRDVEKNLQKMRTFHSRSVPNFTRSHKHLAQQLSQMEHTITLPYTPTTLIRSEQCRKKLEKLRTQKEHELNQRPKIRHTSTAYLKRKPFVPKIISTIISPQPFQLHSVERGKARKIFDEKNKHIMEMRWREQAMEYARRFTEEYMALRKLTVFKARPNPWKRISSSRD